MSSITHLASSSPNNRLSTTRIQTNSQRLGSRSPSSIPSSPTSVHSSSSAIFERDIESPPSSTSLHPHHSPNPHRIPRSKATEQLDQSVPSVLDSAAAILAAPADDDHVAVLAPLRDHPGYQSGFASPIASLSSRSPSPTRASVGQRNSLLLSVPPPPLVLTPTVPSPPNSASIPTARPSVLPISTSLSSTTTTQPTISTPTSAYYSTVSSADESPATTTLEHPPQDLPSLSSSPSNSPPHHTQPTLHSHSPPQTQFVSPARSHPPSPTPPTKRLSFISYADLLASTPLSARPLSALTAGASSSEPPPHLAGLSLPIPATSPVLPPLSVPASLRSHPREPSATFRERDPRERDRDSIALLDDIGGEWEREGLGKGLEERLEGAMSVVQGRA